jgi:hypothetical protein
MCRELIMLGVALGRRDGVLGWDVTGRPCA